MRFPDGIAAQPDVLARSAKALREALPDIPRPHPGEVIALVGIGASEHAARSAAPVWRDQDLRAFAVSASELQHGGRAVADVYVGLSESGRSAETIASLSALSDVARVGVSNVADSPLADVVDHLLCLDSGPDSPVYTTGYTATLQALGMLGESWSGRSTDWSMLPELAAEVLEAAEPVVDRHQRRVRDRTHHRRRGLRRLQLQLRRGGPHAARVGPRADRRPRDLQLPARPDGAPRRPDRLPHHR